MNMKLNFLLTFLTLLTSYSCSERVTYINYGDDINIDLSFSEKIDNNFDLEYLSGQIIDVCPKKGCWMNVKVDTDTVFVKFKDYRFFVPKTGIKGKQILMAGNIFRDTISVKRLKHYAEDAKKSKEEIELISKPEYKINMIASAVAIRDN
ncbi:MAG: DUF4920 domain-containing protein [Flavobacteriaceae bacterium]|nr:DUF4920 domain-containing protein [Flavobacteriaceae bacterium]|tara:strand:+ start:4514 stop:4963 length:450 start_codon:yes stop_codon:yes gene_type:complete